MKYLLLLLLCFSVAAGAADRFVQVTTNGTLVSPTDFFTVNSNLIVSAISGAFGTGSGSGDVVGPFSAPDGALVVFDGTTGKLIKSATVTESQILTESEASSFYAPLNSPAFTGTVTFDSGTFGTLTITTNLFVADVAYGAGWDSSTNVPTRNAVYDKIQSLLTLFQATNANLTTLAALNGGSLTNLDGSKITSGQIPIARMATGTPDGTKFVRDDGTLATPAGSVTSVGATSTIAGLNFSGTPVTGAGTLSLTGVVGVASIDSAVATDAELAAHAALTNSHGVSTLGALLSAQTTTANFRTQLGIGSAALKTDTDFQATNAALTALAGNPGLYQATNSNLSRIGAISSSAGNLIVRDATGWTNLANGSAGQILTATASGQAWSNAPAGGSVIGVNGGTGGAVTNFPDSSSVTWTASSGSATAKTAHRNLASWNAAQMLPCTTAASQASFAVRGVGVPVNCFDPTTANIVLLQAEVPSGFNLAGGLELILKVAPDFANPGTSNVVFQVQYQKLSAGSATVDSSLYSGAIAVTNRLTGAAGVVTNLTFSLSSWSGWSAGETYQIELQKLAGSASDDSTNKACVVSAQLNVISQ